jgi:hypothetical protein
MSNQKSIEFDITEEGIISTDFALVYTDAAYSSLIGYEVPAAVTTFVKAEETSAARKTAAFGQSFGFKKYANVKSVKGTPTKVKQLRK